MPPALAGGTPTSLGHAHLRLMRNMGEGRWLVEVNPALPAPQVLERYGVTPLPPYIRRPAGRQDIADKGRYQTVYAQTPGAVAAPTAGLHFTPELLAELASMGVRTVPVTLHVGMGTFLPVKADDIAEHQMHSEWYDLPATSAEALNAVRAAGGRIIAVGTTAIRVLETAAAAQDISPGQGGFSPAAGWTDIFIYPPRIFRAADALITNFHLPRSTLLMLVAAFCEPGGAGGIPMILNAYRQAIAERYRFFSYGDAMFIE